MKKWIVSFICLAFVAAGGCGETKSGSKGPVDNSKNGRKKLQFERKNEIPEQVLRIINEHPEQEKTVLVAENGQFWIVVTWGEQRTGGYNVKIKDAFLENDENGKSLLTVISKYSKPEPGTMVTQAFTYPRDMVLIKGLTKKPDNVQFTKLTN